MKKKKQALLLVALTSMLFVLTACSATSEVSAQSTGLWDRYIVYYFAEAIKALSFGNAGVGIILFTILIRFLLLPLMQMQTKSMRKMQDIQPELKALRDEHSARDVETQNKLRQEMQRLYAENNVNPYSGCLPLLVQMPIMMALWQAISRVPALQTGHFLWLQLGDKDPYYILPILAAILTFASTYLSSMSQAQANPSVKMMTYIMPLMILVMGLNLASGLSLYWVVSNAFQALQTLALNNPFKLRQERAEVARLEKEREKALKKAMNSKKKRKK